MHRSRQHGDKDRADGAPATGQDRGTLPPVPTGLQRLLRLASVDAGFRAELVARREAIAAPAGVELSASERAILASIPAPELERMAACLPPPPTDRRDFLRRTAATAVVLLGGAALDACGGARSPGATAGDAETAPRRPDHQEIKTSGGAATDFPPRRPPPDAGGFAEPPPDRPGHRDMDTEGGAAPDEPPPRPDHPEMQTTGGAAPDEPPPRRTPRREAATGGGAAPDLPEAGLGDPLKDGR